MSTYRHYKGGLYHFHGTAKHVDTGQAVVVYSPITSPGEWYVRPVSSFFGITDAGVQRFVLVNDNPPPEGRVGGDTETLEGGLDGHRS